VHTWWDHGKNEGIDNDTYPLLYEAPYITKSVKWGIVKGKLDGAGERNDQ